MKNYVWITVVCLLGMNWLFAQEGVKLQGEPLEVLSSENEILSGELAEPHFAPPPLQMISFIRRHGENQDLYLYDISEKTLIAVQPELPTRGVSFPDSVSEQGNYCGDLDWRIEPDKEGRYWFAFVCETENGGQDIFIGYEGIPDYIRLTGVMEDDYEPRWSPDGKSIAFISERSGNGDIYLLKKIDRVMATSDISKMELVQLSETSGDEMNLAWNPDPKAYLLAYSRRVHYPGRALATYQIEVMDVKRNGKYVYPVTDDPLTHYTRPLWDPQTGGKLLFIGQSIVRELKPVLYLSELTWNKENQLQNKILEGYKTVIMKNIRLDYTPAIWLSGGEGMLVQQDVKEQNYPLYAINIPRWFNQQEGAVEYLEELHSRFPFIMDFDARKNNFVFTAREGEHTKIYIAQIYGEDIAVYDKPAYVLSHPGGGGFFTSAYFLTGSAAAAAGAITYFLLQGGNEQTARVPIPIGRPPSMP